MDYAGKFGLNLNRCEYFLNQNVPKHQQYFQGKRWKQLLFEFVRFEHESLNLPPLQSLHLSNLVRDEF